LRLQQCMENAGEKNIKIAKRLFSFGFCVV
jgi:hypothetical protein